MKSKRASVAKVVALAVVPLGLTLVVAKEGQRRKVAAATRRLFDVSLSRKDKAFQLEELIRQGADVNGRDPLKRTPLHYAAYRETPAIQVLLDHGADIDAREREGETPLVGAAVTANPSAVRQLLSRGANCNLRFRIGQLEYTTLSLVRLAMKDHPADHERHLEITRLLKAAGAKE